MALAALYLTGYEHGFSGTPANMILGGGLASAQAGTTSVATTSARNGAYGLHIAAASNTAQYIRHSYTANAKIVARIAVKITTLPVLPTDGSYIFQLQGTDNIGLSIQGDGLFRVDVGGSIRQVGASAADGQWHVVELQADASGTTWTCDWRVDGVAQPRATFARSAGTLSVAEVGTNSTNHNPWTADFDDLIVGSWTVAATDWWGDGKVLAQLPGSDGTHLTPGNFSPGDAGTVYSGTPTNIFTMVDDPPGTGGWTTTRSTTDNIAMRTASTTANVRILIAPTAEPGIANAVRAIVSYSSPTTLANLAACDCGEGANTQPLWGAVQGTGAAFNVTANNFKGNILPLSGGVWNAAKVNTVVFRFGGCTSSDISPVPTVQAMMLEVDWPIPYAARALLASQHHRRPQAVHARRGGTPTRAQF